LNISEHDLMLFEIICFGLPIVGAALVVLALSRLGRRFSYSLGAWVGFILISGGLLGVDMQLRPLFGAAMVLFFWVGGELWMVFGIVSLARWKSKVRVIGFIQTILGASLGLLNFGAVVMIIMLFMEHL